MSKSQVKNISIASFKAVAAIVLFVGKTFLYLCLALYVVGELLFTEYQSEPNVEEPKPVQSMAKTIARPVVKAVEVADVEKESIALEADRDRYQSMTSPQLRQECSMVGIKWRSVHGKSKHLSKAEMLTALLS